MLVKHVDPKYHQQMYINTHRGHLVLWCMNIVGLSHVFYLFGAMQLIPIKNTLQLVLNKLYLLMYIGIGQTRCHLSLRRHSKHARESLIAMALHSWVLTQKNYTQCLVGNVLHVLPIHYKLLQKEIMVPKIFMAIFLFLSFLFCW